LGLVMNTKYKALKYIFPGIFLILLIVIYFVWTSKTALVEKVVRGEATDTVAANFLVKEKHLSRLTSRSLYARVQEVYFEIGDQVKKGDLLLQFADGSMRNQLEEVQLDETNQIDLMSLKSELEFRREDLLEELELAKKKNLRGMLADKDLSDLQLRLEELEGNLAREALSNELSLAGYRNLIKRRLMYIENSKLYSPKDGIVYDIFKREGEVAKPWEPVIDLIYNEKSIVAEVPEKDIERLNVGDECLLKFLAYSDKTFLGKVTYILPKQNELTKTFDVYVKADIPEELLVAGLNGEASFRLRYRENALLVPNQALMEDVLLVVNHKRVERRKVKIGYKGLVKTEVLEGVEEGDLVVIKELTRYREGMFVKTQEN
jgi:RND family efflux transporter MFP subunit